MINHSLPAFRPIQAHVWQALLWYAIKSTPLNLSLTCFTCHRIGNTALLTLFRHRQGPNWLWRHVSCQFWQPFSQVSNWMSSLFLLFFTTFHGTFCLHLAEILVSFSRNLSLYVPKLWRKKTCEITRSFIRWYCRQLVFCRRVINHSSKTSKLVERLDVYDFVEQNVLSATTSPWVNKWKENDQRAANLSLSSQHLFEKCRGIVDPGTTSIASNRRVAIQDQHLSRCRRAQVW